MFTYSSCLVIYYFLLISNTNALSITIPVTVLRVEKFYQCPNKHNLLTNITNIVLSQTKQNLVDITAKAYVRSTVGGHNINAILELFKCKSKEEISTCEYYTRIKLNDLCSQYQIWSDFLKYTDFPSDCPIPSGNYSVNHAIVNLDSMKRMPLFESYWKIKTSTYDELKLISCVFFEFSIEEKRKKVHVE